MIIFHVESPLFKKKHIQCMIHVFEYINHIILSPKILHLDINVHENKEYDDILDAFTEIKESDQYKFPIYSSISFIKHSLSYDRRYFTYLFLHELFHALGCMISHHTKWRDMIDCKNNVYNGRHATEKYVSLFKSRKTLKLYQEKDCIFSNKNHIDGIYDFFSADVYERISPVSLFLLKDYGYHISDKIESFTLQV